MIDRAGRPRRKPGTSLRSGNYWVLVPHEDTDVAVVNEMGHRVFSLCDGTRSCAAIAEEIAAQTRADADVVLDDVLVFVARLGAAGLLQAGEPAVPAAGHRPADGG
jgi:pyrroloquinoline quinone biosynthesis protein D